MKKIIIAFAALAAAFSLVSCNKEQIETASTDLKLNIKVANLDGSVDTKAVKTGWESGDKINIWYEGNAQRDPDLVIKYDGSEWKKDESATVSGNKPAASGSIFYAYEGGNDLSKYTGSGNTYYGINLIYGDNYYKHTPYTYTDGTFSTNIENWTPATEFQVVVTGIDPAKYELKCSNLMQILGFGVAGKSLYTANVGYDKYVPGVANDDGAAFYYKTAKDRTAAASYVFTLKNTETNEEMTYTVTGKTHMQGTFTAIKIAASKFFGSDPEYVTIGGKKWATMNLGATTVAGSPVTCYGDYYAWGETTPRYTGITITPDGNGYGDVTINGWTGDRSYKVDTAADFPTFTGKKLDAEHDAATQALGSAWRTPAVQDFVDLFSACGVSYESGDNINITASGDKSTTAKGVYYCKDFDGVQGILFSDGTNQLFFPRCGFLGNNMHLNKTTCFYWTSERVNDYNSDTWNEGAYMTISQQLIAFGHTIRPVSD